MEANFNGFYFLIKRSEKLCVIKFAVKTMTRHSETDDDS